MTHALCVSVVNPSDDQQSAIRNPQSALTDSPWFWALAFSFMALLALAVVSFSGKYSRRQAGIERQYQARERVAEKLTAKNNSQPVDRLEDQPDRRAFATPGDNLITLWPLAVLLGIAVLISATMLYRASRDVRGPEPQAQ